MLTPTRKKEFAYAQRNPPQLCSARSIGIAIVIFWIFLLNYVRQKMSEDNPTDAAWTENRSVHESPAHTDDSSSSPPEPMFWGDRSFDANALIDTLAAELSSSDPELLAQCAAIIREQHPSRSEIWSQAFQDTYLWRNFFFGKLNGVYLDIGAHKPLHLSNTAFFDKCLGWSGICVEPTETSQLFEAEGVRSCRVARKCVWSESKKLVMIFRSDGDASLIIDEAEQERIKREVPERAKDLFECDATDATDLLSAYTARNRHDAEVDLSAGEADGKVVQIDLISLDVEGAEVEFLRCFPFAKYSVKVWSIEINKNEGLIDELMLRNGFMKVEYLSYFQSRLDAIYVQRTRPAELPWTSEEEREKWSKYERCPTHS